MLSSIFLKILAKGNCSNVFILDRFYESAKLTLHMIISEFASCLRHEYTIIFLELPMGGKLRRKTLFQLRMRSVYKRKLYHADRNEDDSSLHYLGKQLIDFYLTTGLVLTVYSATLCHTRE